MHFRQKYRCWVETTVVFVLLPMMYALTSCKTTPCLPVVSSVSTNGDTMRLRTIESQRHIGQMEDAAIRPPASAVSGELASPPQPTATNPTVEVAGPAQLRFLLEKRWSLANIKLYCIPETRFSPSDYWDQLYWAYSADEIWEGHLHEGCGEKAGRIWWFATVTNGSLDAVSVNVIQGSDHWQLERYRHVADILKPLEPKDVVKRRIVDSVKKAWLAYEWAKESGRRDDEEDVKRGYSYRSLFDDNVSGPVDEEWCFPSGAALPTQYVRHVESDSTYSTDRYVVAISLDGNARPVDFLLDGQRSEYLNGIYTAFASDYSKWLKMLAYGDKLQSLCDDMSWSAHLEALGLDPSETNYLTGINGRHSVMLAKSSNPSPVRQTNKQPNYAAWQSVTNGMSEAEVLRCLGPPEARARRDFQGGYTWRYGTIVDKAQVFPEPYEFVINFHLGHLSSACDPFAGEFSTNGWPTTPKLIHPHDGEAFSNYPGCVDLRWYPSSGEYPMQYEIEMHSGVAETNVTVPYVSAVACAIGDPVRWRVRGVNKHGKSPWSEKWTFRFTR